MDARRRDRATRFEDRARNLLRKGRADAALKHAERAVDLRRRTVPPSAAVVTALVLVAECCTAAGKPVAAVGWHAKAVRRLAWFVEDAEADFADSVAVPAIAQTRVAMQVMTYGRRLDAAGLGQEAGRLYERLQLIATPFRTSVPFWESSQVGDPESMQAQLGGLGLEIDGLPSTMSEVNEVATLCARRGWDALSRDLNEAVAVLGWASSHLGDAYRRPLNRALFDIASQHQLWGQYREMWTWIRAAIEVAMAFVSDPDEANLRLIADTLDLASRGLASAGLVNLEVRALEVAHQVRKLARTPDSAERIELAAAARLHLTGLLRDAEARLVPSRGSPA